MPEKKGSESRKKSSARLLDYHRRKKLEKQQIEDKSEVTVGDLELPGPSTSVDTSQFVSFMTDDDESEGDD